MVGQAIKWLLTGFVNQNNPQFELRELINDSVYPNIIPQDYSLPSIVYSIEKTDPSSIKQDRAIANTVTLDIDILDKSYATVSQITTLLITHLHRYENSYNSNDSNSIGYGAENDSSNYYGMNAPASTGLTQYVGGLQIKYLCFEGLTENYEDKLRIYRNSISFKLMFVDDASIRGADVFLKFEDLNLLATNVNSTDDPLFTQPLAIDQGVNYLFSPSVHVSGSNNISSTDLNGVYDVYYDKTLTSNTNRPTIKKSIISQPQYNGTNYLYFDENKFLSSINETEKLNRKYGPVTFFCVFAMPDSYYESKNAAVVFKDSSVTTKCGSIFVNTQYTGSGGQAGHILTRFLISGAVLQDDGSGGDKERRTSFIGGIVSWPIFGINVNLTFEKPVYFAVNFKRKEGELTRVEGEYDFIVSNYMDVYGDNNDYNSWFADASSTGGPNSFHEHFFNFATVHSDVTSYTLDDSDFDFNDKLELYDFQIWPEFLTFGESKYLQAKKQIIDKYGWFNKTTQ